LFLNIVFVTGELRVMKVPKLREIEFSPLLWKECIAKDSAWRTIEEIYSHFCEQVGEADWCREIKVEVSNRRIKKLINGYAIFDILEWDRKISQLRFKMWQLFEDLVGEILREAVRTKEQCTVVHVDRHPGFKSLDYVITNNRKKEGWTVGIQCKRYIGSALPKSRLGEYGGWSRGTSAVQLSDKGKELHEKFPRKKFVLMAFNAFRNNAQQQQRFRKLKSSWDCVMVFDKSISSATPYTYKIALPELDKIVRWC